MARGFKTGGRQKGTPNKFTAELRDAILKAAELAGDDRGLVGYLEKQARENPAPFMALLGKVLPLQMTGDGGGPVEAITRIETVVVYPDGHEEPIGAPTERGPEHDEAGAVH